jgi:hypothetical protein
MRVHVAHRPFLAGGETGERLNIQPILHQIIRIRWAPHGTPAAKKEA